MKGDTRGDHTARRQLSELRSCVKVEVTVLGSLSLISLMVYVDRCKVTFEEEGRHQPCRSTC